ncbi:MAG: hypothetical protein ABI895_04865 [Deltaproteobacteria bacterium]
MNSRKVKHVIRRLALLGWMGLAVALCGCEEAPTAPAAAGGTASHVSRSSSTSEEASRQRVEAAEKSLNPRGLPVYSGPVGGVRGLVTVSGDPPPSLPETAAKIPEDCPRALELRRKLFRQGINHSLADVLVTVTEYTGYVRPRSDAVRVEAKGCAFDANVTAMVYGQHLEVFNRDGRAYMPRLIGVPSYALRVAMPGGGPVPIFPPDPGRYLLVDETRDYMRSELYVLNYPTFAVTGLDGAFEISGVPAGDAKVTAYSPALGKVSEQRVKIQAGVIGDLKFELAFSQADFDAAVRAQPPEPAAADSEKKL